MRLIFVKSALLLLLLAGCASGQQKGLEQIETIVVIYAENRSFDHLYGLFPGAEGIAQATPEQKTQLDHDGRPLPHLPPVWGAGGSTAMRARSRPAGSSPAAISAVTSA